MSIIHEELYKSEDAASVDFVAYLRKLTADILHSYRIRNEKIRLILEVENTSLGIDTAIPLGIVINELFSNSLKYAFPKGTEGKIRISLSRDEPEREKTGDAEGKKPPEESRGLPSPILIMALVFRKTSISRSPRLWACSL